MMENTGPPPIDELSLARAKKRRGVLSRARINQAASEYIEQHGLEHFTLRGLGASLQVEAMAIYRHVPNREAILGDVANEIIPSNVTVTPPDWQGYISDLAHVIRQVALDHPHVFRFAATYPPAYPWLRPPLHSLATTEAFFAALRSCGLSDQVVVQAYRTLSSFLLGNLLLQITVIDDTPTSDLPASQATVTAVDALADTCAQQKASRQREHFDRTLGDILESLSRSISH